MRELVDTYSWILIISKKSDISVRVKCGVSPTVSIRGGSIGLVLKMSKKGNKSTNEKLHNLKPCSDF